MPSHNLETWPDDAPAVAMDIRLGIKYKSIEVDPVLLRDHLLALGTDPSYMSDLTVVLKKPSLLFRGYFHTDHVDHFLDVALGRRFIKTLTHEGKHFADYSKGEYDHNPFLTNKLTAMGAVAGAGAGLVINEVNTEVIGDSTLALTAITLMTVSALGAQLGYVYSPAERSARAAVKNSDKNSNDDSIVIATKR